eukprot:TRINITY_DN8142_c0_g1_i4.p1 TRINITY_DN8142_c0_g1~~TRINITY_DN8142_c0_g1_i4.p1  ORF type:complete len:154 (+),score=15.12 TRINITY_DN8142_c0_g1_i4:58-462(+)
MCAKWRICEFHGHEHYLRKEDEIKGCCDSCGKNGFPKGFRCDCDGCEYWLCLDCWEKPLKANYNFQTHFMTRITKSNSRISSAYCLGFKGPYGYVHKKRQVFKNYLYCFICNQAICMDCTVILFFGKCYLILKF